MRNYITIKTKHIPELDSDYAPACLCNREYRRSVAESGGGVPVVIALVRPDGGLARGRRCYGDELQ